MRHGTLILLLLLSLLLMAVPASAISVVTGPTTTISDRTAGATAQYTFGVYRTLGNEAVTGYELTFPAGFDVSGAHAVSPPGTVQVNAQTRTVFVTLTNPVPSRTDFSLVLGGIVNPGVGTYNLGTLNAYRQQDKQGRPIDPQPLTTGPAVIGNSVLSLTLSAAAIDLELAPDAAPVTRNLTVTVQSSTPYVISRALGGAAATIGLNVTGPASGAKPSGTAAMTDTLSAGVGWNVEGDRTYVATVTYTVVPQ